MGGMMMLGTAMAGSKALGSIAAGKEQERAYEAQAKMAEMQAQQDEIIRRRELNEALAMPSGMSAAQCRAAGEGSTRKIAETDIRRRGKDVTMSQAWGNTRDMV